MTVLTASLTCPHCGHKKTETTPTNACLHFYECSACGTVLRPKPGDCCVSARTARAGAPPGRLRGHDRADGAIVYSRARMKLSFVRLVATLLLSGQVLPVGLPLLCDQVQRATPASCERQMASHPSGPAVAATTHATPCANSAFCAITTFAPADPQPPLPPPPQA